MPVATEPNSALTPMLRQHAAIKARYPDHIVFFRMGDFFEMFGEDAILGAQILGITLTKRPHGKDGEIPLAGVPHHQAERYLARLIEAGQRVVVCDQVEDPKYAKGLVQRDVVEIITPGTIISPAALDETQTPAVAAIVGPSESGKFALAWAEPTSGRFAIEVCTPESLVDLLSSHTPNEILLSVDVDARLPALVDGRGALTRWPAWRFELTEATKTLTTHFAVHDLDGVGFPPIALAQDRELAVSVAGGLLAYLKETKRAALSHITRLTPLVDSDTITLDPQSAYHLDVISRPHSDRPSLVSVLDACLTSMGRRLLRERLLHPLTDRPAIEHRLDQIGTLVGERILLSKLRELLKGVFDVERFVGRLGADRIGPRDLTALRDLLARWPQVAALIASTPLWSAEAPGSEELTNLQVELDRAIVDDPPLGSKEGGIFRPGYSAELDSLHSGAAEARTWIAGLQARLRAETGIASLKVGYNKVFDYYIEVPKTHSEKVPAEWIRKQTLVNAERFITSELKEKEEIVLRAAEKAAELEERLFTELRARLNQAIPILSRLSQTLATIDVAGSLAKAALTHGYVRPRLAEDRTLEIHGGRHPVLETINPAGGFVPNETVFSIESGWLQLLTGPNMAGKSTYLRQVGLIVLMAQCGSFVPVEAALIGIADRIFTRVGADDDLARNRSTFMVEMSETARILHGATSRSLILFDEVGRGTSTYDGVAIAWAIAEHLAHDPLCCPRTLFATHYHELTALADRFPAVQNHHLAVKEKDGRVVFLFRVKPGACDDSFGIHVARMAGVPGSVVNRAQEILQALENGSFDPLKGRATVRARVAAQALQANLFSDTQVAAMDELSRLKPESMTPLEALSKLDELTRRLRE
jgi:DNA mismatch repair protein MutS